MFSSNEFLGQARLMVCAGLLCTGGSAFGQAIDPGPDIVVEAPRAVPLENERSPYTGASTLVVTLRISALYGDLDLAAPTDVARLMKRLENVSHDACAQLDRLYPLVPDPDCVARAMTGATVSARSLVASAKKRD